jgi:hypothetical protein
MVLRLCVPWYQAHMLNVLTKITFPDLQLHSLALVYYSYLNHDQIWVALK